VVSRGSAMSALGQKQTSTASFDHLVGAGDERRRNSQAQSLGGFEIENKLEFGRLIHWEIARLRPAQNLVHVVCRVAEPTSPRLRDRWDYFTLAQLCTFLL
jgi:hypothetical protein